MLTMRVLFGVLLASTAALVCSPASYGQEGEITDRREIELRSAASSSDPAAVRELACYLYNKRQRSPANFAEAIALTHQAAQGGDDLASLYAAIYLRYGMRSSPNEDEADRILMNLITKIREKRSVQFPTTMDAVKEISTGRCAPRDVIAVSYFMNVDKICRSIKGAKPKWCT
jgi:TPR repeat protein